jgi:hypothetical protein
MMTEKDNIEFTQIALVLNAENAQNAFTRMVTAYTVKVTAMKLTVGAEATEHMADMGQWMLIELAQSLWGLTFDDAATVVRRSIRAARLMLHDAL